MSWDQRRGGRRYFYKSVRTPDGPRRQYVGMGRRAEEAARQESLDRVERGNKRQRFEAQWARIEQAAAATDQFRRLADLVSKATLIAAGYHLHKSHEWRRRRSHG